MTDGGPLLEVTDLVTAFDTDEGRVTAVDGVSFTAHRGRALGLVGESGCGKSVTALSIMRLLPRPSGKVLSGSVRFDGEELLDLPADRMRQIRGNRIGMVFQEPMTALNPAHRIGKQISEVLLLHRQVSKEEAWEQSLDLLRRVGIPSAEHRISDYPHQLSGGMRQRVVVAIALACKPKLLIADEPTTALDVTIQAQILELIKDLQDDMGMAVILITHDLGVIAETCDDAVVMYAGRVVERGPVDAIFHRPQHLYTRGLLDSIPRLDRRRKTRLPAIQGMVPGLRELPLGARFAPRSPHPDARSYVSSPEYREARPPLVQVGAEHWVEDHPVVRVDDYVIRAGAADAPSAIPAESGGELDALAHSVPAETEGGPLAEARASRPPILRVDSLKVHFPVRAGVFLRRVGALKAVDGVDLEISEGETLGLVGESGCGKSTFAKAIIRLHGPTGGSVQFSGREITHLRRRALKPIRRDLQMIFQDPAESLNPRLTVGQILGEPFIVHRIGTALERKERVADLLDKVGLDPGAADRYPFEFSGGQRQRIGIARAIALEPRLVICDEPVSALDVSVQSQILNLLMRLQREMGLSYLFIAHDLAVVKHVSDRIAIMYLGKLVEIGDADDVYRSPKHPYTRALIAAIPIPDPRVKRERRALSGDVPSPIDPPEGCLFSTRCPHAEDVCRRERPMLREVGAGEHSQRIACHFDLPQGTKRTSNIEDQSLPVR